MRSAMIIVGSELCFWERAKGLEDYLRKSVGLRHVANVPAWNRKPEGLGLPFVSHAIKAGRQPFLLAYIGHGYKDEKSGETGWSYGVEHGKKELRLPYETLRKWLIEHREGPTLFLNDCCYAGSFVTPFMNEGLRQPVGLIAACESEGYAYGELVPDVIGAWSRRETYVQKFRMRSHEQDLHRVTEVRHGPVLDRHFFPKPQAAKKAA